MTTAGKFLTALLLSATILTPALAVGPEPVVTQERAGEAAWMPGFRLAEILLKEKRYDDGLKALLALSEADGSADVQNMIGYAHRKLGQMTPAKTRYEKALAIDAKHRGALEYFGEWHVQTGDMAGARALLVRLEAACSGTCEEAGDLREAIATGKPKEQ